SRGRWSVRGRAGRMTPPAHPAAPRATGRRTAPRPAAATAARSAETVRCGSGRESCRSLSSFDRDDSAEVVPLEEHVDFAEAGIHQQLAVLEQLVRDQHVLQRLALLRDLGVAVALAPLEIVVVLDEQPVEERLLGQHLLDQDEATLFAHAA